jgi:hypothetical protein
VVVNLLLALRPSLPPAPQVAAAPPIVGVQGGEEQAAAGCSKEQYREKFGALPTYELHSSPVKPSLDSGFVSAKVAACLCSSADSPAYAVVTCC